GGGRELGRLGPLHPRPHRPEDLTPRPRRGPKNLSKMARRTRLWGFGERLFNLGEVFRANRPARPAGYFRRFRMALQKASRSSGLRDVMRLPSSTTSASSQRPPALMTSVRTDGHDVRRRPSTALASTSRLGAWQMAATSLSSAKNFCTKLTMPSSMRSLSGE